MNLLPASDGSVYGEVEVDKCIGRPERRPDLFAGDDFRSGFDKKAKDLEGLILQGNALTGLAKFCRCQIDLELVEACTAPGWACGCHGGLSAQWKFSTSIKFKVM